MKTEKGEYTEVMDKINSSDSDEDDGDRGGDQSSSHHHGKDFHVVDGKLVELWPPLNYDINAPREIPFGPKTEEARARFARKVCNA